jgi:hypothetical protein
MAGGRKFRVAPRRQARPAAVVWVSPRNRPRRDGEGTERNVDMKKVRTLVPAALAAATIALGTLVAAPSASAAMSCVEALELAEFYVAMGDVDAAHGDYASAARWYGRAVGIRQVCV